MACLGIIGNLWNPPAHQSTHLWSLMVAPICPKDVSFSSADVSFFPVRLPGQKIPPSYCPFPFLCSFFFVAKELDLISNHFLIHYEWASETDNLQHSDAICPLRSYKNMPQIHRNYIPWFFHTNIEAWSLQQVLSMLKMLVC